MEVGSWREKLRGRRPRRRLERPGEIGSRDRRAAERRRRKHNHRRDREARSRGSGDRQPSMWFVADSGQKAKSM